jgi:predicted dithiol-disulfide oxidoreductase (DUF899 family)
MMKGEPGAPRIVDRSTFQAEMDRLRVREKAHTHEGDAIAAERRRLPMVEVDAAIPLVGPSGPVTLLDAFEHRRQLIAYYFMWHTGHPAPEQCEGCTWVTTQLGELSYLHSRDVTFAVFCQGPYQESARYREFMGWQMPWYSTLGSPQSLLVGRRVGRMHIVCYLRQGSKVFETYWTTARGVEVMDNSYHLLDLTSMGARNRGRNRLPAGRGNARTRGQPLGHPVGNRRGRADGPLPSGTGSRPGVRTTCELANACGRPLKRALNVRVKPPRFCPSPASASRGRKPRNLQ